MWMDMITPDICCSNRSGSLFRNVLIRFEIAFLAFFDDGLTSWQTAPSKLLGRVNEVLHFKVPSRSINTPSYGSRLTKDDHANGKA
jgi:hypothetical protein